MDAFFGHYEIYGAAIFFNLVLLLILYSGARILRQTPVFALSLGFLPLLAALVSQQALNL